MKFQSTLPTRGSDTRHGTTPTPKTMDFNPRSPRGGATIFIASLCHIFANFNPRSPRGGATPINGIDCPKTVYFNPRSPRGGATPLSFSFVIFWYIFQSTLPTRGSDGTKTVVKCKEGTISIHAPHEGERPIVDLGNNYATTISIHAPHEGERLINGFRSRAERPFQSTLPTRGSDRYIIQSISS